MKHCIYGSSNFDQFWARLIQWLGQENMAKYKLGVPLLGYYETELCNVTSGFFLCLLFLFKNFKMPLFLVCMWYV